MRRPSRLPTLLSGALLALIVTSCSNLPPPKPTPPPFALRVELPPALEAQRADFERQLYRQIQAVAGWFRQAGIDVAADTLIDRVIVLADRPAVEAELSARFKLAKGKVPINFSGTVHQKTLLLITPNAFQRNYTRLYSPGYRFSPQAYWQLVRHEVAHRAHALFAQKRFGSEEGMGPRWLFEGVAIVCAQQFAAAHRRHLPWADIAAAIGDDAKKTLHYPRYGGVMRSLLASFPLRHLLHHAPDKTLVAELARDYLPTYHVLEYPRAGRAAARGTVLLVHDSAAFNADGGVPSAGLKSPAAQGRFYAELSAQLRAAGFGVLRYHKPGVSWRAVQRAQYAQTDVALLERQLRNLWRFLPTKRPRMLLALGEGSLHLRGLLPEADAVILIGGIATTLADVIAATGGPTSAALKRQLDGKPRTAMLGHDRPVGRLLDELALPPNWQAFARQPKLPLLVLHGSADKQVPVSQAKRWRKKLSGAKHLAVKIIAGGDHRAMVGQTRRVEQLAATITRWLIALPTRVATDEK